jgi:hypothetical protein
MSSLGLAREEACSGVESAVPHAYIITIVGKALYSSNADACVPAHAACPGAPASQALTDLIAAARQNCLTDLAYSQRADTLPANLTAVREGMFKPFNGMCSWMHPLVRIS